MANSKISALTAATTPLAGTEVLPLVQSGTTKKVSVDNLTVGKFVRAGSFQADGQIKSTSAAFGASDVIAETTAASGTGYSRFIAKTADREWRFINDASTSGSPLLIYDATAAAVRMTFNSAGNITFDTGNLIQGTAAKGINFTANSAAAGMTSQLLNWYEEGTWTPAQGGGLTVVGAFSSTGRYTRIGRQVTVSGTVTGATSVAVVAAGIVTTNLPFTVVTAGHGNATNAAVNASAVVICTTTNVTSANAIAATGTITFSATYFV